MCCVGFYRMSTDRALTLGSTVRGISNLLHWVRRCSQRALLGYLRASATSDNPVLPGMGGIEPLGVREEMARGARLRAVQCCRLLWLGVTAALLRVAFCYDSALACGPLSCSLGSGAGEGVFGFGRGLLLSLCAGRWLLKGSAIASRKLRLAP